MQLGVLQPPAKSSSLFQRLWEGASHPVTSRLAGDVLLAQNRAHGFCRSLQSASGGRRDHVHSNPPWMPRLPGLESGGARDAR